MKTPKLNLILLRDLTNIPLAKLNRELNILNWNEDFYVGEYLAKNLSDEGRKRILKDCVRVRTFVGVKNPSNYKLPERALNAILALLANVEFTASPFEKSVAARLLYSFRELIYS